MNPSTQQSTGPQGDDAAANRATQAPVVHMLGTQPPTWLPIARALQRALEASGTVVVATPDRGAASAYGGPAAESKARIIAFVDSPARAVAQWVASGTTGTASAVLPDWRESAQHLLKLVHREPGRCLLIETAEAAAAPDALVRTVARWHSPLLDTRLTVDGMTQPDALCVALAQHLCSADTQYADLFDELHAATTVLGDNIGPPAAERAAPDPSIHRYRALLASEDEKAALAAQIAALRAEIEVAAQVAAQRAQSEALGRSSVVAEIEASREENELLLLQLHRVQEQLEHYYLQHKAWEDTSDRFGWGSAPRYAQSAIHLLGQHDRPPHLHLHFAVENVRSAAREIARLEVRLLDHLGRPGIAVFSTRPNEALAAWQATGDEAGRSFMALLPSDHHSRLLLERMGTADWQLVNHLAQAIRRYLDGEGSHLGVRWQVAAARLCRQLIDMPSRLRYDRLQLGRVEIDGGHQLEVVFGRASYADRLLDQVQLRWRAAGSGGKADTAPLHWLRPEDPTNVPLAAWPAGEDGLLAAVFTLPVGGGDARHKRQQWAALSAGDRALVLAVLDALPGAAERTPDSAMPGDANHATLVRAAHALHKEGRRAVAMMRLRDLVRRILRRTGGGS